MFAGFGLNECDTRRSLKKARLPVLLIHGEADGFVPCDMSVQAYEACAGEKRLLTVPDAEHGLSFLADGFHYTEAVIDFLKENLSGFHVPESRK